MFLVEFLKSVFRRKLQTPARDMSYTHIIFHTGAGGSIYCYSSMEYIAEIKSLSLRGIKVSNIVVNF